MKSGLTARISKVRPSQVIRTLAGLLGAGLLAFAGIGIWQRYAATHNPHPLPKSEHTITHSTAAPDETKVRTDVEYSVPADQVRSINLATVQAEGLVQRVGLDQNGAVAVPGNVHFAGWYVGSAKPGNKGVSLIDGHVQGKYEQGVFKNLGNLKPKDIFSIEYGDRSRRSFEVVSVEQYDTAEAARQMLTKANGISSQLNLITCGGRYDSKTGQYDKRILVVAKLQS